MSEQVERLVEHLRQYSAHIRSIEAETETSFSEEVKVSAPEASGFIKEVYTATDSAWHASLNALRKRHGDAIVDEALEKLRKYKRV